MEELRECPFCGGKAQQSYAGAKHIIICPNCVKLPADGGYIDSKDAVTAWNTRPNNWISVKDRTPKNGDYVFCVSGAGIVQIALYDTSVYVYGFYANSVTHWMPLPEPPKGDEN